MIEAGSLVNRQDMKGRTPAHCAAAKGNLTSIKTLYSHGADLWIKNSRGDFPIHESVNSGKKEIICWLLTNKPDSVNSANNDGRTLLHLAALYDKIEICQVLMDQGAFVNPIMRNTRGQLLTPFDAALHRSNKGCAKYLQLHGGVAAAKITDKSALQKALVRAFSESQGEKVLANPVNPVEKTSITTSTEKYESNSVANQTAVVEMKSTDTQIIIDTNEFSSQTEINNDTKESQTSKETSPTKITPPDVIDSSEAREELGSAASKSSSDGELKEATAKDSHIIIEDEAKLRLQKARKERLQFFHQETINQSKESYVDEHNQDSAESNAGSKKVSPEHSLKSIKKEENNDPSDKSVSSDVNSLSYQKKRSFEDVVQDRFKQDWAVDEMKNEHTKKSIDQETLFSENLIKFQENAENIATSICVALEEKLGKVQLESKIQLTTEVAQQTEQVQEIFTRIESLKSTLTLDFDKKRDELQIIMNKADDVISKAQQISQEQAKRNEEKVSRTFETARKARTKFYESRDNTTTVREASRIELLIPPCQSL